MAKSKLTLKQGEAKRVTCTVTQNGEAVNLTGATLFVGVKKYRTDADYAISKNDAAFNKAQAASGIVSVLLNSTDLNLEPWSYVGELRVAFSDQDGTVRKDVLSTFFLFLAIWAYHGYTTRQTVKRYLLVLVFYGLGLMSKRMLVTFPFFLLLLDFWPLRRFRLQEPASRKKKKGKRTPAEEAPGSSALSLLLEKLPFLGLALVCTLAVSFPRAGWEPFLTFEIRPLSLRIANALVSYAGYLWQTIWPMNLTVFYPFPRSLPWWQAAGAPFPPYSRPQRDTLAKAGVRRVCDVRSLPRGCHLPPPPGSLSNRLTASISMKPGRLYTRKKPGTGSSEV